MTCVLSCQTSKLRQRTKGLYTKALEPNSAVGFSIAGSSLGANNQASGLANEQRGVSSCRHKRPKRCNNISVGAKRLTIKSASISKDCSNTCVPTKIRPCCWRCGQPRSEERRVGKECRL